MAHIVATLSVGGLSIHHMESNEKLQLIIFN